MTARTLSPVTTPGSQTIAPDQVYPGAVENGHAPVQLPAGFDAQADELISRYPVSKRSASLPLLHQWQEAFGYISAEGIEWIAAKLALQPINILELVTFYPWFRQHPVGKIHIRVCRTLSCALGGAYELRGHLEKKCKTGTPDHHGLAISEDSKYSIEFVECLAACGTAPVMMINDDFYENVTHQGANEILTRYEA
jgi:NADH-quinone oxidoreductase subunit E